MADEVDKVDEEVEDDLDQELQNLVKSEEEFMKEEESVLEETDDKIKDEPILIDEDVKNEDEENDKQEVEDNEERSESIEKIERSPQDSNDLSLEEESTTSSKLIENEKDELVKDEEEKVEEEEKEDEEKVEDEEKEDEEKEKKKKKLMQQVKRKSRQCGRQFREIIGKQELKKEELEKREGDLRQRLDVLECSMPAVMVWNVWQRMAQGAPVPNLQQLMEKQFRTPGAGESCCPNTPSQHYDCRIREVEVERKTAHKRLEEARILWLEKEAKLKERRDKLEEAKKIQEERKGKIERLTKEAMELRETLKKMDEQAEEEMAGFCESGECGDVQCRERWLQGVSSVDSIKAIDVECLARLRQLAETELMMKRQIAELERREETYMRTLQHADEMWSKMEGDTADTLSALQEQLNTKTNANQQLASRICELEDELEKLRVRMNLCKTELTKYMSVKKIETIIGGEDDFAKTTDKMVGIRPKVAAKVVGREDDVADVLDKEILIKDEQEDKETLTFKVDVEDKEISPDIDRPWKLMEPEKMDAMHKYLAMLGSLEELYYDDDYGICSPEFACYEEDLQGIATDVELSTTYTDSTPIISEKIISADDIKEEIDEIDEQIEEDDILTELIDEAIVKSELEHVPEELKEIDETFKEEHDYEEDKIYEEIIYEPEKILEKIETSVIDEDNAIIPLNKLRSWVNTIDSIRLVISKSSTCVSVKMIADNLAEEIATYAGVQAKEVITEIIPKLAAIVEHVDEEEPQKDVVHERKVIKEEIISEPVDEIQEEIEMKPEIIGDLETEEIKEEIPMIDVAEGKAEKPVIAKVLPEEIKEEISIMDVAEGKVEKPVIVEVFPEEVKKIKEIKEEIPMMDVVEDKTEKPVIAEVLPKEVKKMEEIKEEIPMIDVVEDKVEKPVIAEVLPKEIKKMEEIKEEIPMIDDVAKDKVEKPIIAKVLPEEVKKIVEIRPTEEEPSDKLDIVSEKPKEKEEEIKEDKVLEIPEEKIIEEFTDIPVKESLIEYDEPEKLEEIEKDIVVQEKIREKEELEDEPKIILPIQKLPDEEEEIFIAKEEEIKLTDSPDKDIIEESIELKEKIDEIEVEQLIIIETEKTDVEDKILEKPKDEYETEVGMIKEDELETEIKSKIEIKEKTVDEEPLVELETEEISDVEEIFVDAETKELPILLLPMPLPKDIPETIEFKEEIPIDEERIEIERIEVPAEKVPEEEKLEEMEMELLEEKLIEIEVKEIEEEEMKEMEEMEEEMPILRKVPEIKEEIEEISDKLEVIEPLPISVKEEKIKEEPKTLIDPRIVATPYLAVADIEEIEKEPSLDFLIPKDLPCVCKKREEIKRPPVLSAMQIVITQTEIVQTIINRGTQTNTVYPMKLKMTNQKSTETGGDSKISERKMRWRKRPKNRSIVSNCNVSSQTEKPLLVLRSTTQETNLSEKQCLLSDILRSLKFNLNTEEKEIRSINYNKKINGTYNCDCCVCGNNSTSSRISTVRSHPLLKLLNTKVPKMDQNTQDERSNYRTLKSNITEKLETCTSCAPKVSKFNKQVCDQEICTCSTSTNKSKIGMSCKNRYKSEKKDQSCLAKISKRKIHNMERKKYEEIGIESITCQGKYVECEDEKMKERRYHKDLDSPSNCICTKIERTESGRLWKREICGCDDYDLSPTTTIEK